MKKSISVSVLLVTIASCTPFNRMTSPEILPEEERIFTIGVAADPFFEESIFGYQPVIGYRTGIGRGADLGLTLYGVYMPGGVVDIKHRLLKRGNLTLSGDVAIYSGYWRSTGIQYDLLFGNKNFYGVGGISYNAEIFDNDASLNWNVGLGSEFGESKLGLQISYQNEYSMYYTQGHVNREFHWNGMLSIGLKLDFNRVKKQYRKESN